MLLCQEVLRLHRLLRPETLQGLRAFARWWSPVSAYVCVRKDRATAARPC